MKLYGIKTCDTCRKALKTLKDTGHDVTFVDIREKPLPAQQIERFLAKFGDELINTRSTTWRGMSEVEKAAAPASQIAEHPTLMKRPVIEADKLHLGWGKDVQAALL